MKHIQDTELLEQVREQTRKACAYFARILSEQEADVFAVNIDGVMLVVAKGDYAAKLAAVIEAQEIAVVQVAPTKEGSAV